MNPQIDRATYDEICKAYGHLKGLIERADAHLGSSLLDMVRFEKPRHGTTGAKYRVVMSVLDGVNQYINNPSEFAKSLSEQTHGCLLGFMTGYTMAWKFDDVDDLERVLDLFKTFKHIEVPFPTSQLLNENK